MCNNMTRFSNDVLELKPSDQSEDSSEVKESSGQSESETREIEINKKKSEIEISANTSLHPAYICSLLVLVGFNFAAFSSFYYNSSIFRKYRGLKIRLRQVSF